ncbi:MAG: SRPBCC family protein [Kovacikia sp.]
MTVTSPNPACSTSVQTSHSDRQLSSLLNGEIALNTQSHTAWGAAVTAQMYLPLERTITWSQLTDYPRWVQYFPDLTRSEVMPSSETRESNQILDIRRRLYQTAKKSFLLLSVQVDAYLNVVETAYQRIQFHMESGSFADFSADLKLQDCSTGTLLTYTVRATPLIPVPSIFIQQAIQLDLPVNLRNMRQVLCRQVKSVVNR